MKIKDKKISYYPIAVNLKNRSAVVVGGGAVAGRKVLGLVETGSRVSVISPGTTKKLLRLVRRNRIIWKKRRFRISDLWGADIIIAATSDTKVNKRISQWAKRQRVLVNVVDRPGLSSFVSPAVLRKGKSIVAVYTDGKDPVLSRDLKNFLKEYWNVFLSYRKRL